MFRCLFFAAVLLLVSSFCYAQDGWVLKSDKHAIKSYSKKVPNSKINAVKLESVFNATLSQFLSVLIDVESYDKWIYNSRSTRLLKKISPAELFYYSEVDFPWPTADRDFVSHVTIRQDPATKVVHVNAQNVTGWVPVSSKLIRIDNSIGEWIITPIANNQLKVEYTLQVDPGGELPGWLINSFSLTGPIETFKRLREWIKKPDYVSAHLSFITD
jgi:hypothetical protein